MRSGLSAFKGVVCLVGMVLLTGAKTNGCGPDLGDGGDPPVVCPDGFDFDGQSCVPIDPPPPPLCPPATEEQVICAATEDGSMDPNGGGTGGDCWTQCVPIDPVCPDGTVEQTICEGQVDPGQPVPDPGEAGSGGAFGGGMGGAPPDPGQNCWTECVPIDPACPPGYHEDWVCEPGCDGTDGCYSTCVPDCPDQCPPGSHK